MQKAAVELIIFGSECNEELLIVDRSGGESHIIRMAATFVSGIIIAIVPLLALTADQMSKIEQANQDCGSVKAVHLQRKERRDEWYLLYGNRLDHTRETPNEIRVASSIRESHARLQRSEIHHHCTQWNWMKLKVPVLLFNNHSSIIYKSNLFKINIVRNELCVIRYIIVVVCSGAIVRGAAVGK